MRTIIQAAFISVYVTRDKRNHTGTYWQLFSCFPNQHEAHDAIERALESGFTFAELRESTIYEKGE